MAEEYLLPQVASDVAKAINKALASVQTVNGVTPDENGNVEVESVSSWNDLTDKPFGEEPVVILEETQLSGGNSTGMIFPAVIPFVKGNTYIVTYNGTDYECVAKEMSAEGLTGVGVGNFAIYGGANTGEPFVLGTITAQNTSMVIDMTGATSCTVKIVQKSVKKLDNKFLDLDWIPKKDIVETVIVADRLIERIQDAVVEFTPEVASAFESFVVTYNGIPYECKLVSTQIEDAVLNYIGNMGGYAPGLGFPNTGEPFVFQLDNDGAYMKWHEGSDDPTVTIVGVSEQINKLPVEYLPEGMPYVEPNGVLLAETEAAEITDPTFGKMWVIGQYPNLTIGETYTVIYNGASFDCVCQPAPTGFVDDANAVAMGNFSIAGGADTGEPFAMMVSPKYQRVIILDLSGASSVRIGIKGDVIHKMNRKYQHSSVYVIDGYTEDLSAWLAGDSWNEIISSISFDNFAEQWYNGGLVAVRFRDSTDGLITIIDRYPTDIEFVGTEAYGQFQLGFNRDKSSNSAYRPTLAFDKGTWRPPTA